MSLKVAELEARIAALETPDQPDWTQVPGGVDVNIWPRSDLWADVLPPLASQTTVLYDPMECDGDEMPGGVPVSRHP